MELRGASLDHGGKWFSLGNTVNLALNECPQSNDFFSAIRCVRGVDELVQMAKDVRRVIFDASL